jgi:hypothetical protein
MDRDFKFKDSRGGSAITIRVTPRASKNEVSEILDNGTIKIRLTSSPVEEKINQALISFLAGILGVNENKIEIVAGHTGKDKLISILDLDAESVHKKILQQL